MWSGPRNLSTAMMYSFAQRADCAVWDEPFYAAYLEETDLDHPMREAVIAAGEPDMARVIDRCLGPVPDGHSLFYQKHMTHHLLDHWPLDWLADVTNVFLIRHPARVVASYLRKRETPVFDDLGFRQQTRLFEHVEGTGQKPVIIDCDDILADPKAALSALCDALDMPFDPAMLGWDRGPKPFDGAWAPHWYGAVHRSTGFGQPEPDLPRIDPAFAPLVERAMPTYQAIHARRLRAC
ncbi:MAG: HAD family hydrolase [Pseudomonadota bacterium]